MQLNSNVKKCMGNYERRWTYDSMGLIYKIRKAQEKNNLFNEGCLWLPNINGVAQCEMWNDIYLRCGDLLSFSLMKFIWNNPKRNTKFWTVKISQQLYFPNYFGSECSKTEFQFRTSSSWGPIFISVAVTSLSVPRTRYASGH